MRYYCVRPVCVAQISKLVDNLRDFNALKRFLTLFDISSIREDMSGLYLVCDVIRLFRSYSQAIVKNQLLEYIFINL